MTFDEWFEEIEVFSSRNERFFDDLDYYKLNYVELHKRMVSWLKTAYEVGEEHGKAE